jgi:RNA-binding protein
MGYPHSDIAADVAAILRKVNMLTSKQRSMLTALASKDCVMQALGKNGLTAQFVATIDGLLAHHELVKIKFLDFKGEKRGIAEELAARTKSELVRVIGHNAIFYRQNPDPEKRRINLA